MPKTVSTTIAAPVRTIPQGGLAEAIIQFTEAFGLTHLSEAQHIATLILVTAAVASLQNAIENRTGRGFLRRVPPRRVPLVDDTPEPKKRAPKKRAAKKAVTKDAGDEVDLDVGQPAPSGVATSKRARRTRRR